MMNDLNSAALTLGGVTLAWALVVFAVWWIRRPRPEPLAYNAPSEPLEPRESVEHREPRQRRLPKFTRKAAPEIEMVEIAPSRLARVSGRAPLEPPVDNMGAFDPEPVFDPAPAFIADPEPAFAAEVAIEEVAEDPWAEEPPFEDEAEPLYTAPLVDEVVLESLASQVEQQARQAEQPASVPSIAAATVRLEQQMPPRDAILRKSWIGGRPHLPAAVEWPRIDGSDGDFLAQIACADLPAGLWDGLGPRFGSLAFFANPDTGAATALHLSEDGPPRDPPRKAGPAYFRPWRIETAELAPLAVRAFPEWPVDLVALQPGEAAPAAPEQDVIDALLAPGYDIADPAFHPFDWATMLAMAEILESRLAKLPTDGIAPDDASDELALAIADAAEANREALVRAREIIAIIHESAGQGTGFSPADATAVMTGLHSVRWTSVTTDPDPETGEDRVEAQALPLTRHHAEADLWVDAYRAVLFDHAKHAYCANPDRLAAPARALFEPVWDAMAARETASMGAFPTRWADGFDPERDVVLLELPASGLRSMGPRTGPYLILAIRKVDLVAGDFAKLRALVSN